MKITKQTLILFIVSPLFFLWSYFLLTHYTRGDQGHYWRFYQSLQGAPLSDLMSLAMSYVSSCEPVIAIVLWVGANLGIEKNIYISMFNVLFFCGIILLLKKYKVPWYIYFFIFTNFYFIVLMTAAERLKFAYILLTYSALFSTKKAFFWALLSPLAHLQSFILLASAGMAKYSESIKMLIVRFRIRKMDFLSLTIALILSGICLFFLWEGVFRKALWYTERYGGLSELVSVFILLVATMTATKNRFRVLIAFIPIIVTIYFLGGMRVNMIAVTIFFYLMLIEGRLTHPVAICLLMYFSVKSIPFVYNIITYGSGFAGFLF
ncbi:hypothetical protein [Desulfonatronovibrio hydrogenovorans]|uniref:hypothetical protein n=1 Tax=Desulfonatronovibrio hydrogenovorans TaxID=53245 RepID=UPI00048E50B1|nr:hypothetical protein [Desulfonatronovibrio hydrogenovorans]